MRTLKILLSLTFLIMLCVVIWGTNKGFELSDEAYYMMGYNQKQVVLYTYTYFWLPVRFIFQFVELNILNVRIIRLILTLTSSLVLSYGFFVWIKSFKKYNIDFIIVLMIALIGNMATYTIYPQSLSYNSLNLIYQNLSTGLLLFVLPQKNKYVFIISFILIGFIIPFQIITKMTTGFFNIFCILSIIVLYKLSVSDFKKINIFIFFISGILLGFIIYFLFMQNIHEYFSGIIEITKHTDDPLHGSENQFLKLLKPFKDIAFRVLPFYLFWIIVLLIYKKSFLYSQSKIKNFTNIILICIFIITFFYVFYFIALKKTTFPFFGIVSFAAILIIYQLFFEKHYTKILNNELIIMTFLLIVPFTVAYGSSDNVWYGSYLSLSMWFLFILWSVYFSNKKVLMKISLSASLIVCFVLFLHGYILNPHRVKPLTEQNIPIENNSIFKGILVDNETYQLYANLNEIIKITTFQKGDPVITVGTEPGLVCLIEGIQYGDVIFDVREFFSKKSIEQNYKYSKQPLFFVSDLDDDLNSKKFLNSLKENGVEFPEKYLKVGTVMYRGDRISVYEFQNNRYE